MFCRVLLVLFLLIYPMAAYAGDLTGKIRVAVLPFDTPEGNVEMRQYGVGTMDSLITGLKNVPKFIMIDRGRIERVLKEQGFQQTGLVDADSAVKVGKLLGAQALITGSMQVSGRKVRLVANFIEVTSGQINDSQKVTGSLDKIFDLQDQLAGLFIKNQSVTVTAKQQQRIHKVLKSTASVTAYDYYLKGRTAYLLFTPAGYQQAINWYRKAVKVDPTYALAYAGLSETWGYWGFQKQQNGEAHQSEYEQSYTAAQQALRLNPDLAEAHRALGGAEATLGMPGVEVETRKAVELNPNDAENWYDLWIASGNGKDPDHKYILKALELNPDLAAAHDDRGMTLVNLQRYQEAVAEFREALRINSNDANAHNGLGSALNNLQRYDEAVAEYREALRIYPNFGFAHKNLGSTLYYLQRYEEAIAEFREALRIDPSNANAHYDLGTTLYRLKRYEDASEEFRATIRFNPNNANAHYDLGNTLADLNQCDESAQEFRVVLSINPNDAQSHYNLGNALFRLKRFDEAIAEYREAIRINPNNTDAHNNLGQALNNLNRYEEAVTEFREAIRINPDDAQAHKHLGSTFDYLKRYEEAIVEYRKALRIDSNYADAHYSLAVTYGELGRWADDVREMEETLKIDPNHAQALEWLPKVRRLMETSP